MNRVDKNMSNDLEKFVDWWVRYYNANLPFKVVWSWKSESTDTEGLCYRTKKEVRFKRSYMERLFSHNKKDLIRDLIAHEMAHFLHEGAAHKSGKHFEMRSKWKYS
jgi:predicted SprT family Zn-dependent metalloprotease